MNELINENNNLLNELLGRKEKVILPEVPYEGATQALKSIYDFLSEVRIANFPKYRIKNGDLYRPSVWKKVPCISRFFQLEKKVEDSEVAKKLGKIIPAVRMEVEKGIGKFGLALNDLEERLEERDKKIFIAIDYSKSCYRDELVALREYDSLINQKDVNEKRINELKGQLGKGSDLEENIKLMNEYDNLIREEVVLKGLYERAEIISSSKHLFKHEEDISILNALEMQRKGNSFVSKGKLIIESTQNVLSHADLNTSSMELLFGAYKSLQLYSSTPQTVKKIADMSGQSVIQLFSYSLPALPQE